MTGRLKARLQSDRREVLALVCYSFRSQLRESGWRKPDNRKNIDGIKLMELLLPA
jgi:hypothetical protein